MVVVVMLKATVYFFGVFHRWWGFSPASACSCWSPPHSYCWPLPSCCAASASAAKVTTTRCRPKRTLRGRAGSQFKDVPSFLFLTFSAKFCPSHQLLSASYFLGWAAPAPATRGSIALHETGHLGLLKGTGQTSWQAGVFACDAVVEGEKDKKAPSVGLDSVVQGNLFHSGAVLWVCFSLLQPWHLM